MKRFTKTLVAAIMVVATGAVIMVGCKKEESTQMKNGVAQTEQSVSLNEQEIIGFLEDFKAMKQGAKAEGEAMKPEEARNQWETVFNYCHGFTQSCLSDMRHDTITVPMPKTDAEGNIAYNDLLATYGEIVAAVRETYKAIDMENKTLKFVMMSLGNGTKDGDSDLSIVINTGRDIENAYPYYGYPFEEGECYIWAFRRGPCDGTILSTPTDAALELENAVSAWDNAHLQIVIPCPNCSTYIINLHYEKTLYGYQHSDSLLYDNGCLTWDEVLNYCICYEDLNTYFNFIMDNSHIIGWPSNPYSVEYYYSLIVNAKFAKGIDCEVIPEPTYRIWYEVDIFNATRVTREVPGYPIPIDEENEE